MNKSIFYYKQLTATEVGNKGTHEIYIRMPNDFNSEDFFQAELESNNGVLEKKFKAKNLTKGHEDDDLIDLRFVHFAQSNNEKRIPSLGDLFKANGVQENDVVRLESRIKGGSPSFYITFLRPDEAQINPKSFCFSVINDNAQDICEHSKNQEEKCLQQIFYGAPGTSKSYTINRITRDKEVIRTTFHPDSDYSTFVGAYKPTTDMLPICNELGEPMKIGGTSLHKEQIVYKFVAQSFLQAYINAWKMWLDGTPQYLVIEEINRGNCAQIFGDLFQLLDRNDAGYSDYPITADKDMQKQIGNAFGKINLSNEKIIEINSMYNGKSIAEKIFNGELLVLPNNLYIWATMNTSDQSLFPIDSAFKRRWDWTYMPISDAGKGWVIEVNNKHYDWWDFLTKINDKIASTTSSEDKKLGYFFCKADKNKIIKSDRFVGKVLFYLWNDVFKDYEFNNDIFNDESDSDVENKKLSFDKFYKVDGGNSIVVEDKVELFLRNLGVTLLTEENNILPSGDTVVSSSNVEIKVNGQKVQYVNAVPYTAIEQYVKLNPNKTSEEILRIWDPFKQYSIRKWIVAGKEEREAHKDGEYSYEILCADGNPIYVNKDGWMYHPRKGLRDTISEFIQAVNAANLGIKIEENSLQ